MPQRVPFGVLYQAIHPGGRRLPKLPSLTPDSIATVDYDYSRSSYTHRPGGPTGYSNFGAGAFTHSRTNNIISPTAEGNLSIEAYRFFVGRTDETQRCQCRGCLVFIDGKDERADHVRTCKYLVLEALKLLNKDKRCVTCNKRTESCKWGTPLCGTPCQTAWKFALPSSFLSARGLVLTHNPKLMRGA